MKTKPAHIHLNLISTDKDEPVSVEIRGLDFKVPAKGKPASVYTVKTNGNDQAALVEDGIVICHLIAEDEIDLALIPLMAEAKLEIRKNEHGERYPVAVIDSPIPGKKAMLVLPEIGDKAEPVAPAANPLAVGTKVSESAPVPAQTATL